MGTGGDAEDGREDSAAVAGAALSGSLGPSTSPAVVVVAAAAEAVEAAAVGAT